MTDKNPYELMGSKYAEKSKNSIHNAMYERPAIISLLPELENKEILDAGCGSGTLTSHLLDSGARVTGIDLSPSLVAIAREEFGERAIFHVADLAQRLDFIKSGSIDLIVSSLALHYVEDWFALFAEFGRILSPNGIIVFTTHHPSASRRWMDLLDYFKRKKVTEVWTIDNQQIPVSYYHRPLSEMVDAFRAAGFLIDKLLEPKPEDRVKEIDPLRYYYLSTKEHFIGFRLIREA